MATAEYIFQLVRMLDVFPGPSTLAIRHQILESAAQVNPDTPSHEAQARCLYIAVLDDWTVTAPHASDEYHRGSWNEFGEAMEDDEGKETEPARNRSELIHHNQVLFLAISPGHAKRLREGKTKSAFEFPSGVELAKLPFGPDRIGFCACRLKPPLQLRRLQVGPNDDSNAGISFGIKSLYMNAGTAAELCREHGLPQPERELIHPLPRSPSFRQLTEELQLTDEMSTADLCMKKVLGAYPSVFPAGDRYQLAGCARNIFRLYQVASLCFSGPEPSTRFDRRARQEEAIGHLHRVLPKLVREVVEMAITLIDPCEKSQYVKVATHTSPQASKALAALDRKFGKREAFVSKTLALVIYAAREQFGPQKPPSPSRQKPPTLRERLETLGFADAEVRNALMAILTG